MVSGERVRVRVRARARVRVGLGRLLFELRRYHTVRNDEAVEFLCMSIPDARLHTGCRWNSDCDESACRQPAVHAAADEHSRHD